MTAVTPLAVPLLNVNDETVLLARWAVGQYATVAVGDPIYEVETSKATSEVTAERAGVLVQTAQAPSRVAVGQVVGAIAPTVEAAAAFANAASERPSARGEGFTATAKAKARAMELGVALEAVARDGVKGTIKESDVVRFAEAQRTGAVEPRLDRELPPALARYVETSGAVSTFEAAVSASLRRSAAHAILASVDAECDLTAARARIDEALAAGRMTSLLHLVIVAVSRTLPRFPLLMSVVYGGGIYRYRGIDIAFVARTPDGRLYTPVIRSADRLTADEIAARAQAESVRVMRGSVRAEELEGACFTVSHIPVGTTSRVAALPNAGQSAILGVAAERLALAWANGAAVARPAVTLTLTYDHAVCDGLYAASFLADVCGAMGRVE
jgi:pyruvate/2-oxoglutarate dehydrogenase complex dihydrolipoamide acyltransferase (E2) component